MINERLGGHLVAAPPSQIWAPVHSNDSSLGAAPNGGYRVPTPVLPLPHASSVRADGRPSAEISAARRPLVGTPIAVTDRERPS
jgi:hypothetical protein